jgi:hypothetical protein
MYFLRFFFVLILSLILFGCSSQQQLDVPDEAETLSAQYCDLFLIYDMCAVDVDIDGDTDVLYFGDTKEVFMYDASVSQNYYQNYPIHACAQEMDENMKAASNSLLRVNDDMSFGERFSIKKNLMMSYARYFKQVRECREALAENTLEEDSFGSQDDDEFY